MQAEFKPGTLLNQRYHIIKTLGQGGFGRTYLAEDRNRYNERCAIKELLSSQSSEYALAKSRELFQREAATLYRIRHPQVPQFLATFEDQGRLFIVQDYVEGQTLQELLEARRRMHQACTEAEVRYWLEQLLRILGDLHSQNIIHRDVSPGNIILRSRDQLPVLIDFGVVKELATRIKFAQTPSGATTVGKVGYAPREQMQTGEAYPSSDLYSLAVTAIVLLTGREPQNLFDQVNFTWYWRQFVTVSEPLGQVLDQMLRDRPQERFNSAQAVLTALSGGDGNATVLQPAPPLTSQPPSTPPPAQTPTASPAPPLSQMKTWVVGGGQPPVAPQATAIATSQTTATTEERQGTAVPTPLVLIFLVLSVSLAAGLGAWGIITFLRNSLSNLSSPAPQETVVPSDNSPAPSPTATSPTPTSTPSPAPSPSPPDAPTRSIALSLSPVQPRRETGTLEDKAVMRYTFVAKQGQRLNAQLASQGTLMSIFRPNGRPVGFRSSRTQRWNGLLRDDGTYSIQIDPKEDKPQGNANNEQYRYELTLQLTEASQPASPNPTPSASPSPSTTPKPKPSPSPAPSATSTPKPKPSPSPAPPPATPTPSPEPQPVPVNPDVPTESQRDVGGQIGAGDVKHHTVTVAAGQILTATVLDGLVELEVQDPNGRLLGVGMSPRKQVTLSGTYQVVVMASGSTRYQVRINVQNPP